MKLNEHEIRRAHKLRELKEKYEREGKSQEYIIETMAEMETQWQKIKMYKAQIELMQTNADLNNIDSTASPSEINQTILTQLPPTEDNEMSHKISVKRDIRISHFTDDGHFEVYVHTEKGQPDVMCIQIATKEGTRMVKFGKKNATELAEAMLEMAHKVVNNEF